MPDDDSTLLLTKMEYCHVKDFNTAAVTLVKGPHRGFLESHEEIYGDPPIKKKIVLQDGQYAIVLNPFREYEAKPQDENAPKGEVLMGDREVRIGPQMFALHPGEELDKTRQVGRTTSRIIKRAGRRRSEDDEIVDDDAEYYADDPAFNGIRDAYVLKHNKGLLLKALNDFGDDSTDPVTQRNAGDEWIVKGPCYYIPQKYGLVKRMIKAISLGDREGVYVKDIQRGKIRLESGPNTIMLTPDEELWSKPYTKSELKAIDFQFKNDMERAYARPLWVLDKEVTKIMSDASNGGSGERTSAVVFGPKVVMLDPYQRPYIMDISGNTPKEPNYLKIWKIKLGPNFSTDTLGVRTKDNAVLEITLRYKWRFRIPDDEKDYDQIFQVSDFIGLMTETMGSLIRDECAKHDFEDLHSNAMKIVKTAVFGTTEPKTKTPDQSESDEYEYSYIFKENGLKVIDIDIKRIAPEDDAIADQLNEAIKSNMTIYVDKLKQNAKLEAEREAIEGKKLIEEEKKELIKLEQANMEAKQVGSAKIKALALMEEARGEAEAIKVKSDAETDAKIEEMKRVIETVKADDSKTLLQLEHIKAFGNIRKVLILPTDSKLFLPSGKLLEDLTR